MFSDDGAWWADRSAASKVFSAKVFGGLACWLLFRKRFGILPFLGSVRPDGRFVKDKSRSGTEPPLVPT